MQKEGQSLGKNERLKSRKIINDLFDCGKIIHHYPFKILFKISSKENSIFPAQIAVSASKRNFKRAVDRIKIKRKIKEAYRQNKHLLYHELNKREQKLNLFVIYTAKQEIDYSTIDGEMKNLIQKIIDKL